MFSTSTTYNKLAVANANVLKLRKPKQQQKNFYNINN